MHSVYLLTGCNLGDRALQLEQCRKLLNQYAGTLMRHSSIYETAAWGIEDLPPHFNQALLLHTHLSPLDLLTVIHDIERKLGRVRQEKWGVRSMDIDIIYFDNLIINLPNLTIPHPLMQERHFVLAPIAEIAPNFVHPLLGKTNSELLQTCKDQLKVQIL